MLKAEGLSYVEIGERLGWTYTKVNRCITEGRRRFMRLYEELETGAECERLAPVVAALAAGTVSSEAMLELRPHLRNCAACRATVRRLHASRLRRATAWLPLGRAGGAGTGVWSSGSAGRGRRRPSTSGRWSRPRRSTRRSGVSTRAKRRSSRSRRRWRRRRGGLSSVRINVRSWVEVALQRLQSSDLAMTVHATSSGGGGRIGAVAALIGVCVSGVGAGTYCVATALLPDPKPAIRAEAKPASKPKKAAKAKRDAQLSRLPSPASQAVAPTPTPARRSRPRTADRRNRSARATSKPRSRPPRRAPRTSRSSSSPPIPDRSRRRLHHRPEEGSSNHDPSPVLSARLRGGRSQPRFHPLRERARTRSRPVSATAINTLVADHAGNGSPTRTSSVQLGAPLRCGMVARNTGGPGLAPGSSTRAGVLRRTPGHTRRRNARSDLSCTAPADGMPESTTTARNAVASVRHGRVSTPLAELQCRRTHRPIACPRSSSARWERLSPRRGPRLRALRGRSRDVVGRRSRQRGDCGRLARHARAGERGTQAISSTRRTPPGSLRRTFSSTARSSRGRTSAATPQFAVPCPNGADSAPIDTASLRDGATRSAIAVRRRRGESPAPCRAHICGRQHAAGATASARRLAADPAGRRRMSSGLRGATRASADAPVQPRERGDLPARRIRASPAVRGRPSDVDRRNAMRSRSPTPDNGAHTCGCATPRATRIRATRRSRSCASTTAAGDLDSRAVSRTSRPLVRVPRRATSVPARGPRGASSGAGLGDLDQPARRRSSATGSRRSSTTSVFPDGVYELRARAVDRPAMSGRRIGCATTARRRNSRSRSGSRRGSRSGSPKRVRARGADGKRRYRIVLIERRAAASAARSDSAAG